MKIKSGDKVKVLSGKDRGKTGKVMQVLRHGKTGRSLVVVDGVNKTKKHMRPARRGEKGRVLELFAPIDMSKVMMIDPKTDKPTRVGYKYEGSEKKRVAKKSGEYL